MYYNYIIEDYAGTTNSVKRRMWEQRRLNNRNIEKVQVVKAHATRREALDYEFYLETKCGYKGKHGWNKGVPMTAEWKHNQTTARIGVKKPNHSKWMKENNGIKNMTR